MTTRLHALVTGATAGIGLEFARQLAVKGYDLTLIARDRHRLSALQERLHGDHGGRVDVMPLDLATSAGIAAACGFLRDHASHVVVHNAGFGTKGLLHRTASDAQEAMVTLHVTATDRLMRAALPGMIERRSGHLIVVSSVASFVTSAGNVNYAATKAYQRTYMESLALELAGTGVTAQALCPGFTRTEFHDRAHMKTGGIPLWLWMTASDVVRAGLDAMDRGRPTVVIPGRRWRVIALLLRHLPKGLLRLGARRYRRTRADSP